MPTPCTVSGNLQALTSGQIAQGRVIFQLANIGTGNPVGVSGTSIFPALVYSVMTGPDGSFSVSLWGNDNINPLNTLYAVTFRDPQGNEIGPVLFNLTGATANLNSAIPVNNVLPPVFSGAGAAGAVLLNPVVPQTISGQSLTLTNTAPLIVQGAATFSGAGTHSGIEAFKYLNNVRYADQFAGGDCGAKINAADTDLGATVGEIWVNQNCGTLWTTVVTITSGHVLRFIQGGTYSTNQIKIGASLASPANSASIIGSPTSTVFPSSGIATNTVLFQTSGTNASPYIVGNGSSILLRDIIVDGNVAGNASAGPNINIFGSSNILQNVTSRNSASHGLQLGDGTAALRGATTIISDSNFNSNTGSGILLNWTQDFWLSRSQLDNNTRYGLECTGCGGPRLVHNDIGGNTLGGALFSGTVSFNTGVGHITANIFKNNFGHDLDLESDSGGTPHTFAFSIVGNTFGGLAAGTTANTFSAIRSNGAGNSSIVGNIIRSNFGTAPTYKYCINIAEPTLNQEAPDLLEGNQCTGTFGTASFTTTANTFYDNNNFVGFGIGQAPYRTFVETTAPSGASNMDTCYGDFASHTLKCSYNNGSFLTLPQTIASSTAAMTTAAITTGACGTTVTVAAAGVLTTDTIDISHNAAATNANGGNLILNAWPTAGNVNFNYCNPSAATVTPTAMTLNWSVRRP
jgi:hypothetical protein